MLRIPVGRRSRAGSVSIASKLDGSPERSPVSRRQTVIGTSHDELVAALDGTGPSSAAPAIAEIAARYRAGETVD